MKNTLNEIHKDLLVPFHPEKNKKVQFINKLYGFFVVASLSFLSILLALFINELIF